MSLVDVAEYWYDDPHSDCGLLRQGDIFFNLTATGPRSAHDVMVVVSQSCDLREDPSGTVLMAYGDLLETWLADNGLDITQLEEFRKRKQLDVLLLPRYPGVIETEILVHVKDFETVGYTVVCEAVKAGQVIARATEVLSGVVGHQVSAVLSRPAIRTDIPPFTWETSKVNVDAVAPAEIPGLERAIPLNGQSYTGRAGSGREEETWFRVMPQSQELQIFASTMRKLADARAVVIEHMANAIAEGDSPDGARARGLTFLRDRHLSNSVRSA